MAGGYAAYRMSRHGGSSEPYWYNGGGGTSHEEITTLWVGNLPPTCTDTQLFSTFASQGAVMSAVVTPRPAPSGARSGFVRFASRGEAEMALSTAASGQIVVDKQGLICQFAKANSFGGVTSGGTSDGVWDTVESNGGGCCGGSMRGGNGCGGSCVAHSEDCSGGPGAYVGKTWVSANSGGDSGASGYDSCGGRGYGNGHRGDCNTGGYGCGRGCGYGCGGCIAPTSTNCVRRNFSGGGVSGCAYTGYGDDTSQIGSLNVPSAFRGGAGAVTLGRGRLTQNASLSSVPTNLGGNGGACGGGATAATPTEELTTLWLGNLPPGVTEQEVIAAFSVVGQVLVATIHPKPSLHGSYSGFVRLLRRSDAEMALAMVTGGTLLVGGVPVVARWAKGNSKLDMAAATFAANMQSLTCTTPAGAGQTLHLGNLPLDTNEQEVNDALSDHGVEGFISIRMARPTNRALSAFIKFQSLEAAQDAINLISENPPTIQTQTVQVEWAKQDSFS
eukprot:TRINITY_DN67943_c0_g1_i1.p1 TRINITY_DN67943_c0_g1~~TRINITY_DN67943_c0_g1_i1.p1  ORF type:complete len:502 (+),score=87.27 TRINITY_DN67943_c0_g1_i1:92-1597(+)